MKNSTRSLSQGHFAQVPALDVKRSTFNRPFTHKTTFNAGYLIPIFIDEMLPSDVIKVNLTAVCRLLSPLKTPIMDNLFLDFQFWGVPNRQIWNNWERFLGAQDNPDDPTDFLIPVMDLSTEDGPFSSSVGTVFDYAGIPTGIVFPTGTKINSLPFRAMNRIFDQWYRDENLQDSVPDNHESDGPDLSTDYKLMRRGHRHDFFTSSLPFAQKGDPVEINLGGTIPVYGDGNALGLNFGSSVYGTMGQIFGTTYGNSRLYPSSTVNPVTAGSTPIGPAGGTDADTFASVGVDPRPGYGGLIGDLSSATFVTINDIRKAAIMQQILEANARGGTRYNELIMSQFGTHPEDYRLQRPEYLGGSSQPLNVSTVPQTSESATTPQGNLAAFSAGSGGCHFIKSFVEHCYVIGFASVRADLIWQNQLRRLFQRQTVWDFWRPQFAGLGEQAVLNSEMSFTALDADNQQIFGYQERGSEYRYFPNMVSGYFRSNSYIGANSLDSWHLAYDFGYNVVPLNDDFIQEQPPIDRVIAVTSEDTHQFLLDASFQIHHTRPMPVFSVPGIRRF